MFCVYDFEIKGTRRIIFDLFFFLLQILLKYAGCSCKHAINIAPRACNEIWYRRNEFREG